MLELSFKVKFLLSTILLFVSISVLVSCGNDETVENKVIYESQNDAETTIDMHTKPSEPQIELTLAEENALLEKKKLSVLSFMSLSPNKNFECSPRSQDWSIAYLTNVIDRIREYKAFLKYERLDDIALVDRPLYDNVAREQLVRVLNANMRLAQIESDNNEITSRLEENLSKSSKNFDLAIELLVVILHEYTQLGFTRSKIKIVKCISEYVDRKLVDINVLAKKSFIYEPSYTFDSSNEINMPLYTLSSAVKTNEYLDEQFNRTKVLASYASPFVQFINIMNIKNISVSDYWKQTLIEMSLKLQYKNPLSQAVILDDFIRNNLAIMTGINCSDVVNKQKKVKLGKDLFSEKRAFLQQQSKEHCERIEKQRKTFTRLEFSIV